MLIILTIYNFHFIFAFKIFYKFFHCGFKFIWGLYVYIRIYPQSATQIKVQNVFGPLEA